MVSGSTRQVTSHSIESARQFLTYPVRVELRNGHSVIVRGARREDAGALAAMHTRCSAQTAHRRYGSSAPRPTGRLLASLLGTECALVALSPRQSLVALGNLAADSSGAAELAVLVEDDWQGRGLGTALVRQLVAAARLLGYREATMIGDVSDAWPLGVLSLFGTPTRDALDTGDVVTTLTLAPHHVAGVGRPLLAPQRELCHPVVGRRPLIDTL